MKKVLNFSGGHEFRFFSKDQCTFDSKTKKWILKEGETPKSILPAPSSMLRANIETTPVEIICVGEVGIGYYMPIEEVKVVSCDPLPPLADDEIGVVSMVYAVAAKAQGLDTSKVFTTTPCYPNITDFPCGVIAFNVV